MCAWEGVRLLPEIEVGACVHERVSEFVSEREKERWCMCSWEREKETERERETGRHTDRHRETHTHRQTDRQIQRDRQTGRDRGGGCLSAWEKYHREYLREKREGRRSVLTATQSANGFSIPFLVHQGTGSWPLRAKYSRTYWRRWRRWTSTSSPLPSPWAWSGSTATSGQSST